jgi:hypothetical protein
MTPLEIAADHPPTQYYREGRRFKPLSSVPSRSLAHLWEPYLPEATFGMLEGDPWLGKSLLLQQAAADLSRGLRPGPAPRAVGQPRRSLLLIGEENPERVRERLVRMNARLDDIFFPLETEQGPLELEPDSGGLAVLEEDVALLRPALCVIDPVTVFAPRALTSQAGIRALTGHLKRIAQTQFWCTRRTVMGRWASPSAMPSGTAPSSGWGSDTSPVKKCSVVLPRQGRRRMPSSSGRRRLRLALASRARCWRKVSINSVLPRSH